MPHNYIQNIVIISHNLLVKAQKVMTTWKNDLKFCETVFHTVLSAASCKFMKLWSFVLLVYHSNSFLALYPNMVKAVYPRVWERIGSHTLMYIGTNPSLLPFLHCLRHLPSILTFHSTNNYNSIPIFWYFLPYLMII